MSFSVLPLNRNCGHFWAFSSFLAKISVLHENVEIEKGGTQSRAAGHMRFCTWVRAASFDTSLVRRSQRFAG